MNAKIFRPYGLLWALFVTFVSATTPNVGWDVEILSQNVSLSTDFVSSGINIFVDASISIIRISSPSTALILNFFTSPYMANDTDPNAPRYTLVHTETVDVANENALLHPVFFDFPEPTQDVLLSVIVDDGLPNFSFQTQGTVLSTGSKESRWTARVPAEYDHEINVIFTEEVAVVKSYRIHEGGPRDLGIPPISDTYPLQIIPKENAQIIQSSSTAPVVESLPSISTPDVVLSTPVNTNPENPSVTPMTNYGASTTFPGLDGSVTIIQTVTVGGCACPTSSEVPSASPSSYYKKHQARDLDPRQNDVHPAYVNVKMTYQDRNFIDQPVRLTTVVVEAAVFAGDTFVENAAGAAITDIEGRVVFRFETLWGQRIEISSVYTFLDDVSYKIGTRFNIQEDLHTKIIKLDISENPWKVDAGEIINPEARHPWSEYNRGLAVADAYRYISDFMRTQVVRKAVEQVQVHFPGDSKGAFFSEAGKFPYINLPQHDGDSPSVMAHEYGHYAHFLARQKKFFAGGGNHTFCGDSNRLDGTSIFADTAFSEGYATAFGQMALDETPMIDPDQAYMLYIDRASQVPTEFFTNNVETFTCFERFMLRQEGRVGAVLFDLVDRQLDVFPQFSDDAGKVEPGFDPQLLNARWTPQFIFWTLMQNNPLSIEKYWRNLKANLNAENEAKAWAIFDYNYADFPR